MYHNSKLHTTLRILAAFVLCWQAAMANRLQAQEESVSFQTALPIGAEIRLELVSSEALRYEGLTFLREEQMSGLVFSVFRVDKAEPKIIGALKGFDCSQQQIVSLDLTHAQSLQALYAFKNNLTQVDVSHNKSLAVLDVSFNQLEQLTVTELPALANLEIYNNRLTSLTISKCPALSNVGLHENNLSAEQLSRLADALPKRNLGDGVCIVVNKKAELDNNRCPQAVVQQLKDRGWVAYDYNGNPFSILPYKGDDYVPTVSSRTITLTTALTSSETMRLRLRADELYQIEHAEIVSSEKNYEGEEILKLHPLEAEVVIKGDIRWLDCSSDRIQAIRFNEESLLTQLVCRKNELTELDLTACGQLHGLDAGYNRLQEVLLADATPLVSIALQGNALTQEAAAALVAKVAAIKDAEESGMAVLWDDTDKVNDQNRFDHAAVKKFTSLGFKVLMIVDSRGKMWYYKGFDYVPMVDSERWVTFTTGMVGETLLIEATPSADGDIAVEGATPLYLDSPMDSPYEVYRIDKAEVTLRGNILRLDLGRCGLTALHCEHLPALEVLLLTDNPDLINLDLSHNTALRMLQVVRCGIKELPTDELPLLTHYYAGYSALQSIDLTHNPLLEVLNADLLGLTTLDLSHNTKLRNLSCSENKLTDLSLDGLTHLEELDCAKNELTHLTLPAESALRKVAVNNNQLAELQLGNTPQLEHVACYSNKLTREAAGTLLRSLPSREGKASGFMIIRNGRDPQEVNEAYAKDVASAKDNNWLVLDLNGNIAIAKPYQGVEDNASIGAIREPSLSYAREGALLYLNGLPQGSRILLFSLSGQLMYQTKAAAYGETTVIDLAPYDLSSLLVVTEMGSLTILK